MRLPKIFSCTVAGWLGLAGIAEAGANWSIGIGIGSPGYYRPYYRPYYGYGPGYYYRPYVVAPVYVGPPPIVVASPEYPPPPVEVAPAPTPQIPPPRPVPNLDAAAPVGQVSSTGAFEQHLQRLTDADERVRLDAVTQLGRLRSERGIDPLAATLSGDRSPAVREAAAKALGLIGSPKALPALTYSARVDQDAHVRSTSQFAAEILQGK